MGVTLFFAYHTHIKNEFSCFKFNSFFFWFVSFHSLFFLFIHSLHFFTHLSPMYVCVWQQRIFEKQFITVTHTHTHTQTATKTNRHAKHIYDNINVNRFHKLYIDEELPEAIFLINIFFFCCESHVYIGTKHTHTHIYRMDI